MNSFIHNSISYKELDDEFIPKILELQTFKDFLYRVDATYGCYKDSETGREDVVIKCSGNNFVLMVEFLNEKFNLICKVFPSISKKGKAFEVILGKVLLQHFTTLNCHNLLIHNGKNEFDLGGEE